MIQSLNRLKETPSQTAGPYVHIGCVPNFSGIAGVYPEDLGSSMVNDKTKGERITIRGNVIDGSGTPLRDALLEIWQADADGNYDTNFKGFGRQGTGTNNKGNFIFETIKPGSVNGASPHINVIVFMRGLLSHLYTRIYFSDEVLTNEKDEVKNFR